MLKSPKYTATTECWAYDNNGVFTYIYSQEDSRADRTQFHNVYLYSSASDADYYLSDMMVSCKTDTTYSTYRIKNYLPKSGSDTTKYIKASSSGDGYITFEYDDSTSKNSSVNIYKCTINNYQIASSYWETSSSKYTENFNWGSFTNFTLPNTTNYNVIDNR